MVLEQSQQILLSELAEEESIDLMAELLECKVGGHKESATSMLGRVQSLQQASLCQAKGESAELAGKHAQNGGDRGRREKNVVNTVLLVLVSIRFKSNGVFKSDLQ